MFFSSMLDDDYPQSIPLIKTQPIIAKDFDHYIDVVIYVGF